MSSFGSSLINKSGKKVVPRATGRRRPGAAAAAVASQDAAPSARSSVESSQTPQPEPLASKPIAPTSVPTPEESHNQPAATAAGSEIPDVQTSVQSRVAISTTTTAQAETSQALQQVPGLIGTTATVTNLTSVQSSRTGNETAISAAPQVTRQRSISPIAQASGPAKRRRIERESEPARSASPPVASTPLRGLDDEIPVVLVSKRALSKPSARTSKANAAPGGGQTSGQTNGDGLVQYETPAASNSADPSAPTNNRRASRPAIAPLLVTSVAGPKPRAKGTRRQQWQVTTQADLAPRDSREDVSGIEQTADVGGTEADSITIIGPKARKVRKDKGIRKGSRMDREESTSFVANASQSGRTGTTDDNEALSAAATRGRRIAPQPTAGSVPAPVLGSRPQEVVEPDSPASPVGESASARLRNAQRRRAKQIAADNARSRAAAPDTATAIDRAIAQSIETRTHGRLSQVFPNLANPLFRVQAQDVSRSRRSSTVDSDMTELTVVTEGGTRQKKRYKRQATPPGHETVFIAEKVTPMISLVGRDTENRVGMRSNTELKMREFDWKQIRREQKEEWDRAAIAKGSRRTNDISVILDLQYTPRESAKPASDAEGEGGEGPAEDSDEDELDRRIRERRKKYGKSGETQITMVNGEHRLDLGGAPRGLSADIDQQIGEAGELSDNELKKRRFNVQTFQKWKRRDPAERVYQSSRWTDDETEKFYEALRCCGVDFGSMVPWFPSRIRRSLKRKFNIEERVNPERIEETLQAHMMMLATGEEGGDDGTGWDMDMFEANGAFSRETLKDPKEVEEELAQIRAEKQVEIDAAKDERLREKENKRLAGAEDSEDEEEGEEEGEEEDDSIGGVIRNVQQEMIEKKRKQRAAAEAGAGAEQDKEAEETGEGSEDDDDEVLEDDAVLETVEDDYEGDEEEADWDE
jgi:transcription factor TFIIIB component B''